MRYAIAVSLATSILMLSATTAGAIPLLADELIAADGTTSVVIDFDGAFQSYGPVNIKHNPSGTTYSGVGGQFKGYLDTLMMTEAENDPLNLFNLFCADMFQPASNAPRAYTAYAYDNDNLRKLYDIAYPGRDVETPSLPLGGFGYFAAIPGYNVADLNAAFQLSVWEIVTETAPHLSLTGGDFVSLSINSKSHIQASAWLEGINSYQGDGYESWSVYRMDSPAYQDFVTASYTPAQVSEPAMLALLGIGLFGLGLTRRPKTKTIAVARF